MSDAPQLSALVLNCTLSPSPKASSTELLSKHLLEEFSKFSVQSEIVRVVDYDVKPGVEADMGDGDQWPELRKKMLAADILIVATPTWMGHMSSVAQRVVERLDAELSETDDEGRFLTYGKVGAVVVVGNEDGAHKIIADTLQSLNDVGFTIAASGAVYWNGEAMRTVDYKDLDEQPEMVKKSNVKLAANAVHLAQLLKQVPYPPSA